MQRRPVRAQHSQGNENEADEFAMQFLSRRQHDRAQSMRQQIA